LITVLDKFNKVGFKTVVNISCKNIIISPILKMRFTILILFKPEAQKIINSLSFSNFKIVDTIAIKKQKGINFVHIFDIVRKEYVK
jgi:hypothetical protein